jgi:uncharacterized protein YtpQ (UPF0354 family)
MNELEIRRYNFEDKATIVIIDKNTKKGISIDNVEEVSNYLEEIKKMTIEKVVKFCDENKIQYNKVELM